MTFMKRLLVVAVVSLVPVAASAQPATPVQPRVVYVETLRAPDNYAQLKDVLTIKVAMLQAWRGANPTRPLALFLDGVELKDVPLAISSVPGSTTDSLIKVRLEVDDKNADNRKNWVTVLKGAKDKGSAGISVAVGPSGAPFVSASVLELRVEPWYEAWVWAFLGVVLAVIVILARRSNLLRDDNGTAAPPYSLAKHQWRCGSSWWSGRISTCG
jgi:hypothetical protein